MHSLKLEKRTSDFESWEVTTNHPGFFILSETDFPGWQAMLNNKNVPILKAFGLFRAIWIDSPGTHTITFEYKPFSLKGH